MEWILPFCMRLNPPGCPGDYFENFEIFPSLKKLEEDGALSALRFQFLEVIGDLTVDR